MTADTVITAGLDMDPERWAERERERLAVDDLADRVRVVVNEILLAGYREGVHSFEALMREARRAVRRLPAFEQRQFMGALALAALDLNVPPRKGRGRPPVSKALCTFAADLVALIREREKLPTKPNAASGATCYERAAELLGEYGVSASAKTIEAWASRRS